MNELGDVVDGDEECAVGYEAGEEADDKDDDDKGKGTADSTAEGEEAAVATCVNAVRASAGCDETQFKHEKEGQSKARKDRKTERYHKGVRKGGKFKSQNNEQTERLSAKGKVKFRNNWVLPSHLPRHHHTVGGSLPPQHCRPVNRRGRRER